MRRGYSIDIVAATQSVPAGSTGSRAESVRARGTMGSAHRETGGQNGKNQQVSSPNR